MLLIHLHKVRQQDLGPFIKGLNSNLIFNLKLTLYSYLGLYSVISYP